jgi:putative SOS response-associated peptidase YedK
MPVIVQPRDYDRWLKLGDVEQQPVDLLRPYPADEMSAAPANPAVGNVKNNGPDMLVCPDQPGDPGLWE